MPSRKRWQRDGRSMNRRPVTPPARTGMTPPIAACPEPPNEAPLGREGNAERRRLQRRAVIGKSESDPLPTTMSRRTRFIQSTDDAPSGADGRVDAPKGGGALCCVLVVASLLSEQTCPPPTMFRRRFFAVVVAIRKGMKRVQRVQRRQRRRQRRQRRRRPQRPQRPQPEINQDSFRRDFLRLAHTPGRQAGRQAHTLLLSSSSSAAPQHVDPRRDFFLHVHTAQGRKAASPRAAPSASHNAAGSLPRTFLDGDKKGRGPSSHGGGRGR
jgi:hypothetical protein